MHYYPWICSWFHLVEIGYFFVLNLNDISGNTDLSFKFSEPSFIFNIRCESGLAR